MRAIFYQMAGGGDPLGTSRLAYVITALLASTRLSHSEQAPFDA